MSATPDRVPWWRLSGRLVRYSFFESYEIEKYHNVISCVKRRPSYTDSRKASQSGQFRRGRLLPDLSTIFTQALQQYMQSSGKLLLIHVNRGTGTVFASINSINRLPTAYPVTTRLGSFAMHKLIASVILLAVSSVSLNGVSAADKQEMCHKGDEISIAGPAVPAHLAHGDTVGECEGEDTPTEPERNTMAAVVMMRCEAITDNGSVVVSLSSSNELDGAVILPFPPAEDPLNCAETLARLLNADYMVRSITSGSAQSGEGSGEDSDDVLHLYTDYLLLKKVPEPT
jgi:hypothetical protein